MFRVLPLLIVNFGNSLATTARYLNFRNSFEHLELDGGSGQMKCNGLEPLARLLDSTLQPQNKSNGVRYFYCPFNPSPSNCVDWVTRTLYTACLSDAWYCVLDENELCGKSSLCLSDLCNCPEHKTLFYCADGKGCTDIDTVCDGQYDCIDWSDETLCQDLVEVPCKLYPGLTRVGPRLDKNLLFSQHIYCMNSWKVHTHLDLVLKCDRLTPCLNFSVPKQHSHASKCLMNIYDLNIEHEEYFRRKLNFSRICLENCKDLLSIATCSHLDYSSGEEYVVFVCATLQNGEKRETSLDSVCDGSFDCHDNSDEINCLDRFYCTAEVGGSVSWVPPTAVCNSHKDCESGIDECSNCFESLVSSDQFLVRNHGVFAWLIMSCFSNLVMNVWSAKNDINSPWKNQPMYVTVDKVLKLQICFYDSLMGGYLLCLVIANIKFFREYCSFDEDWRYSWGCKSLGLIYNFSSHGSLITVLLMSVTRAYKCKYSFSRGISIKSVVALSTLLAIFNACHSTLPVLPLENIQNVFRVRMMLPPSNPFIVDDFMNISHVSRIYSRYFEQNGAHEIGLYEKLEALRSITSTPEIFDYKELSFYSWSPVCVQDIYGFRESLQTYKTAYLIGIIGILLLLTASYTFILYVFSRSSTMVQQGIADGGHEVELKIKVSLIIGTKLVSWLTIIAAMSYYTLTRAYIPDGLFKVTAICIIPTNSLLNPVFDSDAYNFIKKLIGKTRPIRVGPIELQMENITSPGSNGDFNN